MDQRALILQLECDFKKISKKLVRFELGYACETLTLDQFLRKMLRSMKLPAKSMSYLSLKMKHLGSNIIIQNDSDLAFIIRGQLLAGEPIEATLIQLQTLAAGKQQIAFNEEGEKISQEIALNEPSDARYKPKAKGKNKGRNNNNDVSDEDNEVENVSCAFCKESISNKECIKQLGWFYGPFRHKKKQYYVHLMCAIWTPDVYLDEKTNKMQNVRKEIARSNKIMCRCCGLFGGGLGCCVSQCKMSYHFKCGVSDAIETRLDHEKFQLYCPEHTGIYDDMQFKNVHCEKCQIDENEELILLCDGCDRPLHTYCLDIPLKEVPQGDWFCSECQNKRQDIQRNVPIINNSNNQQFSVGNTKNGSQTKQNDQMDINTSFNSLLLL